MERQDKQAIISELALDMAELALAIDKDGRYLKDIEQFTWRVIETVGRYYQEVG